jgi:hypothetical protein
MTNKPPWALSTLPIRPKTPPTPLCDVLPPEVLTCACGRMWASADAKARHIEQAHGGVEPEETGG